MKLTKGNLFQMKMNKGKTVKHYKNKKSFRRKKEMHRKTIKSRNKKKNYVYFGGGEVELGPINKFFVKYPDLKDDYDKLAKDKDKEAKYGEINEYIASHPEVTPDYIKKEIEGALAKSIPQAQVVTGIQIVDGVDEKTIPTGTVIDVQNPIQPNNNNALDSAVMPFVKYIEGDIINRLNPPNQLTNDAATIQTVNAAFNMANRDPQTTINNSSQTKTNSQLTNPSYINSNTNPQNEDQTQNNTVSQKMLKKMESSANQAIYTLKEILKKYKPNKES